ncbi:MAG: hypothetical protein WBD31_08050 [Rubripirellula sp.]
MNRFVSLLLIPMFMLGHALPHSHAGTAVVEPDGHSLRPHIHVSGGHHHDHDDHDHGHHHAGDPSQTECPEDAGTNSLLAPTDHDSDAIYLVDSDWTMSRTVAAPRVDLVTGAWSMPAPSVTRAQLRVGDDPPDRYAGLPIYLLTASLRL